MFYFYFSCEHGGNKIPAEYCNKLIVDSKTLNSHKGWDIGILPIAKNLAKDFNIPLAYSEVTRLLIELNRSEDSTSLFSKFSVDFSLQEKKRVLDNYYLPYRSKVEQEIGNLISQGKRVIHISLHSFTPILNGVERDGDIGLLYDPSRNFEAEIFIKWLEAFNKASSFKALPNFPYLGTDDGFTTFLRTRYKDTDYAGIELEINQKFLLDQSLIADTYSVIKCTFELLLNQLYI